MKKTICDNCGIEMGGPDYHYSGNIVLQPGNVSVSLAVGVKPTDTEKDVCGRCARKALEMLYSPTEQSRKVRAE